MALQGACPSTDGGHVVCCAPAMYKLALAAVAVSLGLAGCAQPRDAVPIVVTHEGGRPVDVADSRARDEGRSAGAGGTSARVPVPVR
jgi:hypothetical protein